MGVYVCISGICGILCLVTASEVKFKQQRSAFSEMPKSGKKGTRKDRSLNNRGNSPDTNQNGMCSYTSAGCTPGQRGSVTKDRSGCQR